MVHAMVSNLKQQELEIEEVVETIHVNITQGRSDLRVCLPELGKVLDGLMQEQWNDTRHLASELGVNNPVAILWEQRVVELEKMENQTLHLIRITMKNMEEDLDDWSEATIAARPEAATKVKATEDGAASWLQAADSTQPTTTQVLVRVCEANDAALSLPLGEVTRADANSASWPQTASEQGGEHCLPKDLATLDAMHEDAQPSTDKVTLGTMHEDAQLNTGMATLDAMQDDAQLNTDLATGEYNDLQVKVDGYNTLDTASHPPIGKPGPPEILPLSARSATSLLDKLLDRTAAVHRKLDMMTTQAAKRKSMSCTLNKVDKLALTLP